MRFLHVADTHLGYAAYRKTTEEGINQRELDVYNAFEQFVDYAIKTSPDMIIHAGDLFDSVRPNNRAINHAMKQLIRLSNKGIPFIFIAGNHEHPKLKETGHIFSIFDHVDHVHPVYKGKYEKLSFDIKNEKVSLHIIPQCNNKQEFKEEFKKVKPDEKADYNIFVSHGAVTGIQVFSMNEFNELIIPTRIISKNFDYIALGHYHKYTQLGDNAFYAGSTENLTFADAGDKKGFLELNLSKNNLKHNFIEIKARPMVDSKPIQCSNLKIEQIMDKIKQTVNDINPNDKTFRITLEGVPANVYRALDFNEIKKISKNAVHYEIKADLSKDDESRSISTSRIDALINEFKQFLEHEDIEDKDILLEMGLNYIEKIEAREEGR